MNPVLWRYRNVVNPWQTVKEIRNAIKFIDRMIQSAQLTEEEALGLLNAGKPDRNWE